MIDPPVDSVLGWVDAMVVIAAGPIRNTKKFNYDILKKYSQLYQFYIQYNKWCLDYQYLSTGICPVWT